MHTWIACGLIAAGSLAPRTAHAEPERRGFTLELGIGAAVTLIVNDSSEAHAGLAPLSLSLGAFATPDLAILFRASGTSYFTRLGGNTAQIAHNFYGAAVQYWLDDPVFIGGGIGVTLYDDNVLFGGGDYIASSTGVGLELRAGYCVGLWDRNALAFAVEVLPAMYDGAFVVGTALQFQWQLF